MVPSTLMLFSLFATFSLTSGLKCYQCEAFNSPSDPCHNPGENVASVDCPKPYSANKKMMCGSLYIKGPYTKIIARGCSTAANDVVDGFCSTQTQSLTNLTGTWCFCSTDKCIDDGEHMSGPDRSNRLF